MDDRHFLAQTTVTGAIFSLFFGLTFWLIAPEAAEDFFTFVVYGASGPCGDRTNDYVILAFVALQPVLGIVIDSAAMVIRKPPYKDDPARRLLSFFKRYEYTDYVSLFDRLENRLTEKANSGALKPEDKDVIERAIAEARDHVGASLGRSDRSGETVSLNPDHVADVDFATEHCSDPDNRELVAWGRRQLGHFYWSANWSLATVLGIGLGFLVGLVLSYGWPFSLWWTVLIILVPATPIWLFLLCKMKELMADRERRMAMIWTLDHLCKKIHAGDEKVGRKPDPPPDVHSSGGPDTIPSSPSHGGGILEHREEDGGMKMSGAASRNTKKAHLHPEFRKRAEDLISRLEDEKLPFKLFEGFRSPQRQAYLYAQGRTRSGDVVTHARAWESYHQYGVAGDFVLFEDGRWSWDDRGENKQRWERLHELGRACGLKPLKFEKPHLQLDNLRLADLAAGRYPQGGEESWAANLEEAILSWKGDPPAPPIPDRLQERPPMIAAVTDRVDGISSRSVAPNTSFEPTTAGLSTIEKIVAKMDKRVSPEIVGSNWHNIHDGIEWRHDDAGVYIRSRHDGRSPLRSDGDPITCKTIMELYGQIIFQAAIRHGVPVELIVMTIATETGHLIRDRFTGLRSFRWEGLDEYSAGPMQTLSLTVRSIVKSNPLPDYDPYEVAPSFATEAEARASHIPLFEPSVSIDIGTAIIKDAWPRTGDDPILVAAAYNAGGLHPSEANRWRLRVSGDHLDRAARWFGDACAIL